MIHLLYCAIIAYLFYCLYEMYKMIMSSSDSYREAQYKISLLEDEIDRLEQLIDTLKQNKGRIPREDEQ